MVLSLARLSRESLLLSRLPILWATGLRFSGLTAAAHTLARLRIAGPVSRPVARLATDLLGSCFDRAGFAPAGRLSEFQGLFVAPFLSDQPFLVALAVPLPAHIEDHDVIPHNLETYDERDDPDDRP